MSTYLITCTPAHGHVVPLVAIARHLVGEGHRVLFLTSERYADRVRASGARFLPLPAAADVDLDDPDAAHPQRTSLRGPAAIRFDMLTLFLAPGAAQFEAVQAILADEAAVDAVLTEPLFVGAALLAEIPRSARPPIVALGIFPLGAKSRDTAPFGLGIPPLTGPLGRVRNAALTLVAEKGVFGPVTRAADQLAREVVGRPLSRFFLDWAGGADAVAQFTVPSFEYPRSDLGANVHFLGPLPSAPSHADAPEWWGDLDGTRPIVHVTQGTVANSDLTQLIGPACAALADEDVLVVVTTGGRDLATLPPLPANARAARYLPYDALLPRTDVLVTNGGYGGVQQALAHGIPVVVAGQTEDKIEVSARVGWSGVGINLKTNRPSASQVRSAVRRVLDDEAYRTRAQRIGEEIRSASGLGGFDRLLAGLQQRAASDTL
ncbi:glycosyltransferase [Microbacterium sp. RD1]|uniref:glycosyltransferase n=1 Tax=Microbacterium sp. RD1 TaxID=3457313 RepID=UPI003FA524A4